MVGGRQVRREKPYRREVELPLREPVEDDWEAAGGAGGLDAVVGLVLGEAEGIAAVDEERRIALPEVDVAGVELGEVGDELGRGLPLASGQGLQARDEIAVGKVAQGSEDFVRHAHLYHHGRTQWVLAKRRSPSPSTRSGAQ